MERFFQSFFFVYVWKNGKKLGYKLALAQAALNEDHKVGLKFFVLGDKFVCVCVFQFSVTMLVCETFMALCALQCLVIMEKFCCFFLYFSFV